MVNYFISVVLTESSCDRNYLMKYVVDRKVLFRGRQYWFKATASDKRYELFCNGWLIGGLCIDEVLIYKERAPYITSVDLLKALISLFNLFPL